MYLVASAFGATLIPLIIFIIGILVAKKSSVAAWILFAVGAVLELLSLLGNGKTIAMASGRVGYDMLSQMKTQYALTWVFFVVFAVIAAVMISKRAKK
jgi:hypothetical protein